MTAICLKLKSDRFGMEIEIIDFLVASGVNDG